VKMSLQEVDYILTGFPPPTTIYVPTWSAYVFDWINYYSAYPSQPIMKKAPVFGKMAFSNETHEIFKDVDQVLFLGSSFIKPHVPALAGIGTHPTTSRPRGAYPYDESFQMVVANEHVAGRYVISCDSNCFANDGFAKSDLANTDNKIFAMNVFNWLAQNSSEPEIDEIKIKDLESGLFVSSLEMSSIKGIKNFQAIGFKNGEEGDPVPVTWSFSGGDVTTDSMRAKILTKLDVNVGKIGIFETSTGAQKEVHDATQVKFVSYLSSTLTGNIIIIANEDTVPQKEVSIRLKQPKFDVKVWPVDSVDTGLFTPWQTVVTEVWNRESILHVGTFELGSQIDNILAPNPPLVPLTIPYAEPLLPEKGWGSPSFMNPIVYDSKLVETFGANIVPRQPYELFSESRNIGEINVYLVEAPLQYSLVPTFPIPQMGFLPHTAWTIDSNGAKDFAVKGAFLDDSLKSGICVKRITPPYTDEFKRILAHEIGHTLIQTGDEHDLSNITPPAAREENLMEGGGIAKGLKLAPEQYISILNLDGQKTNSAIFIREE